MTPRRRITSIIDQQHALRELGIVRFSDPMTLRDGKPHVGRPNVQPRVTGPNEAVIRQVAEVYGDGAVEPWRPVNDSTGPQQFACRVTDPKGLAIAVPPGIEPYTLAYERWSGGFLQARCDGAAVQYRSRGRWHERACVCNERGLEYDDPDRCGRYLRVTFAIVGVRELGVFRVNSKSFHASRELPIALALLQRSGRAGRLTLEQRSDRALLWDEKKKKDNPTGRRYPVLVVSAPFLIDEVTAIERSPDMLALPAPSAPPLPRGARPQLGPGADLPPTGPAFEDVEPPPIDPAPPALPDDEPVAGEIVDPDPASAPAPEQSAPRRSAGREALDRLYAEQQAPPPTRPESDGG